jgi:hypothetical protein
VDVNGSLQLDVQYVELVSLNRHVLINRRFRPGRLERDDTVGVEQ